MSNVVGIVWDSIVQYGSYVFALGIVIVLIILALWIYKVLFRVSSGLARRGRRLSVVETLTIDPKRQLLIIRRDNADHLILTGGPQDLVIETGIPVDEALAAANARRPLPTLAPAKPAPQPRAKAVVPAPEAPAEPVADPAPAVSPRVAALDRLRTFGKSATERRPTSLRHTGLMRPVSQMELAPLVPEKSDAQPTDSAKEVVNSLSDQSGQTELGDSSSATDTAEHTADRN